MRSLFPSLLPIAKIFPRIINTHKDIRPNTIEILRTKLTHTSYETWASHLVKDFDGCSVDKSYHCVKGKLPGITLNGRDNFILSFGEMLKCLRFTFCRFYKRLFLNNFLYFLLNTCCPIWFHKQAGILKRFFTMSLYQDLHAGNFARLERAKILNHRHNGVHYFLLLFIASV